jgi:hypothetical protein
MIFTVVVYLAPQLKSVGNVDVPQIWQLVVPLPSVAGVLA